ncbi:stage II sporulation protein M [Candidatus Woesearchaeota archaeon]|nr:stage II sporulation protein M [Candidatus Woesearchaeota archaeon]
MLDQLFNLNSIKGSSLNIILLGVIYGFLGTFSALLLFPHYVAIMSFAFTSILLIPSIGYMIARDENIVARERHFSVRKLFSDHKDIMRLYILVFIGIFIAYMSIGALTSTAYVDTFFDAQLRVAGIAGQATGIGGEFAGILLNNLLVLGICFLLSLAYGAGSIIFIVWNASVWGIVFGYFIRQAVSSIDTNPLFYFAQVFLPFLPHMVTEAASYIVAAVMGGILAKAVIREKLFSHKFNHILVDALLLGVVGFLLVLLSGVIEVFVFPLFL